MAQNADAQIEIRRLGIEDIGLIGEIDRSEQITALYAVEDGQLVRTETNIDVPRWDPHGDGEHSVARLVGSFRPVVAGGAILLGAFDSDELAGLALVDPTYEPGLAWLALLHVSRRYRRRGVASALWSASDDIARGAGAAAMYVSATESNSAVGFYMSRGCELADPPHPELLAKEPEDIHFVCHLA